VEGKKRNDASKYKKEQTVNLEFQKECKDFLLVKDERIMSSRATLQELLMSSNCSPTKQTSKQTK
jgi:hypothetical protein